MGSAGMQHTPRDSLVGTERKQSSDDSWAVFYLASPELTIVNVLPNAPQDFLLRRILLIKPGHTVLEMLPKLKAQRQSRPSL
jgi:hypothetical protein